MGIRNREAYFNVNSDDDGNVHESGVGNPTERGSASFVPRKEVQFYLDMLFVEREIMDLYKKNQYRSFNREWLQLLHGTTTD